jgi:hypothetical protein
MSSDPNISPSSDLRCSGVVPWALGELGGTNPFDHVDIQPDARDDQVPEEASQGGSELPLRGRSDDDISAPR